MYRSILIRTLVSVALYETSALAGPVPAFTRIAPLGAATTKYVQVAGGTVDGNTLVGWSGAFTPSTEAAVRWTRSGGLADLGAVAARTHNTATGTSADGLVVVGTSSAGALSQTGSSATAFAWTLQGGLVSVSQPSGHAHGFGSGVSADGSTVVGYGIDFPGDIEQAEAFRLPLGGSASRLRPLSGYSGSYPVGTSRDGQLVGGVSTNDSIGLFGRATLWDSAGVAHSVNPPGSTGSVVAVMAANSSLVIKEFVTSTLQRTWLRDATGAFTQIPGMYDPTGISDDGEVVIGRADLGTDRNRPVIWTRANGLQELAGVLFANGLDLATARAIQPTAIAVGSTLDTLTLVGETPGDNAQQWGFVLTGVPTIPSPSAAGLLALAGGIAALRRQR